MCLFLCFCTLMICSTAASQAVSGSSEKFSMNFMKTVARKLEGNFITSPFSVDVVLSMAAYGARQTTAIEMRNVLKLPANDSVAKDGFLNLIDKLNSLNDVDLRLANKIFTSKTLVVKPEFKKLTTDKFQSTLEQVDFTKSAEAADAINSWCEKQTNNKIKDLFNPNDLDSFTAMILVNAIYFKGKWKYTFDPKNTSQRCFHIDDKTTEEVSTMHQETRMIYGVLPELKSKFVEIPYKGLKVNMYIILPDEVNGLAELEQKLETISLKSITLKGRPHIVDFYLPKFKIESSIELNNVLQEMGMVEMFTNNANFSGIADANLSVDKVIQKAFIEVNEEGSEAAAATGMSVSFRSFKPNPPLQAVTFNANRPFLYFLTYKDKYGSSLPATILFSGRINNPIHFQGEI